MEIIKPRKTTPKSKLVTCVHCGAELLVSEEDRLYGCFGDHKLVTCPCCSTPTYWKTKEENIIYRLRSAVSVTLMNAYCDQPSKRAQLKTLYKGLHEMEEILKEID